MTLTKLLKFKVQFNLKRIEGNPSPIPCITARILCQEKNLLFDHYFSRLGPHSILQLPHVWQTVGLYPGQHIGMKKYLSDLLYAKFSRNWALMPIQYIGRNVLLSVYLSASPLPPSLGKPVYCA